MAKKEFSYRGKSLAELQEMSTSEFSELLPSRERRTMKRGLPEEHKRFMDKLERKGSNVKTHCRDIIIFPLMVGKIIRVHTGKVFHVITITDEMIGHRLGEFAATRNRVAHSAPGVGAG